VEFAHEMSALGQVQDLGIGCLMPNCQSEEHFEKHSDQQQDQIVNNLLWN